MEQKHFPTYSNFHLLRSHQQVICSRDCPSSQVWQKRPRKFCADNPIFPKLCALYLVGSESLWLSVEPAESFCCLLRTMLSLGDMHHARGVPLSVPVGRRGTGALLLLRVLPQALTLNRLKPLARAHLQNYTLHFLTTGSCTGEKKYKWESQHPFIIKFYILLSKLVHWDYQGSQAYE